MQQSYSLTNLSVDLSQETIDIIQRASRQAIEQLHKWFEENKVTEVKTRLTNLLLLLTPLSVGYALTNFNPLVNLETYSISDRSCFHDSRVWRIE